MRDAISILNMVSKQCLNIKVYKPFALTGTKCFCLFHEIMSPESQYGLSIHLTVSFFFPRKHEKNIFLGRTGCPLNVLWLGNICCKWIFPKDGVLLQPLVNVDHSTPKYNAQTPYIEPLQKQLVHLHLYLHKIAFLPLHPCKCLNLCYISRAVRSCSSVTKKNASIAAPGQKTYGLISWKREWKEKVQGVLNLFLEEKGIEQGSELTKLSYRIILKDQVWLSWNQITLKKKKSLIKEMQVIVSFPWHWKG